jgi:membrane protease YdiL (CAAX protease family)
VNNNIQRHLPASVLAACAMIAAVTILFVTLGWLPLINAALLFPFVVGLYGLATISDPRRALLAAILLPTMLIGFFIAIFRPKGFSYPLVWNPGVLYEGGEPFSLYVNLSKAIGGYFVVVLLGVGMRGRGSALIDNRSLISQIVLALIGVCAIIFAAFLYGLAWKPKLPDGLLYFVAINLMVTVLSEEAFFRLLVQYQVERFFRNKRVGIYVGIATATLLFALAHAEPAGAAFFLYLFAGFIYATVYAWTRSLLAGIATHFGVNLAHIILLEYPL